MRQTWNSFKLCQGDMNHMSCVPGHSWHSQGHAGTQTLAGRGFTFLATTVLSLVREGNSAKLLCCLVACSETQWDRCMWWNPPRLQARAKLVFLTCFFSIFFQLPTLVVSQTRGWVEYIMHPSMRHWDIVTYCDILWLRMTIAPAMTCHLSLRPPRPYHRELATCAAALSLKARPRRRKGQSYPSCFRVRFMRLL